jgi:exopolysaccharide/PEP-CTERM locus tyrosine autokinase
MGKFYEALRRSGASREQPPPEASANVVKISGDTAKDLATEPRDRGEPAPGQPDATGIDPRLATWLDPESPASECFKMLRTKLLVAAREKPLQSILVTSAEPLDGKSLVAANLAVSIAQGMNEHVLLVDCDLRAPSIHKIFNLNVAAGIREYLKDGTSLDPFLVKTYQQKLTLLPGGSPATNPSELLCSSKMQVLVDELKSRYQDRFVIFDSPPGEFMAETAFLARLMDATLLVVRYGKTSKDLIHNTLENIGRDKIFGVVFNASHERQSDYQYYYRYYRKPKG